MTSYQKQTTVTFFGTQEWLLSTGFHFCFTFDFLTLVMPFLDFVVSPTPWNFKWMSKETKSKFQRKVLKAFTSVTSATCWTITWNWILSAANLVAAHWSDGESTESGGGGNVGSGGSCESLDTEPGSSSSRNSLELELGLRGIWDWYQSRLSSNASRISWASGWTKSAHVSHNGWTM